MTLRSDIGPRTGPGIGPGIGPGPGIRPETGPETDCPPPPEPTLRLDIDRAALADNWRALDRLSRSNGGGGGRAGAAIKADCYGLGIDRCLPVLRDAGARDVFVAHWSEVAGALRHVPGAWIAVLHGANTAAEARYAIATGVRPVINSLAQARLWREAGGGACLLMVDTGINRLGVAPEDVGDPAIAALPIAVVLTHLACADEDSAYNATQLARFHAAAAQVDAPMRSIANSAGIALGPRYRADLTRPGLAMYGGIARPELAGTIRQVAYPRAALIQTARVAAGEGVGYNHQFVAPEAMAVGTVSLGYADGFLRAWGGAALGHQGRALPILGKVSMDMVVVDLRPAPDLAVGAWLDVPYHLPDAARRTGLSQYELLTVLGGRFRR